MLVDKLHLFYFIAITITTPNSEYTNLCNAIEGLLFVLLCTYIFFLKGNDSPLFSQEGKNWLSKVGNFAYKCQEMFYLSHSYS